MKKVLIVEDDEFLSESYKVKLASEGMKVLLAHDGDEAIILAQSRFPDLIILDMVMPNKNGIDVLKKLKSDGKTRNIPVVVASNIDSKKTMDEALMLGAKEYFIKSNISISELCSICKKYLEVD